MVGTNLKIIVQSAVHGTQMTDLHDHGGEYPGLVTGSHYGHLGEQPVYLDVVFWYGPTRSWVEKLRVPKAGTAAAPDAPHPVRIFWEWP